MSAVDDFIHRYVAATDSARTLLLHGKGGDEQALLGMGAALPTTQTPADS